MRISTLSSIGSSRRVDKPGKDFYPLLASVQVVILFYIFFFYDMMEF